MFSTFSLLFDLSTSCSGAAPSQEVVDQKKQQLLSVLKQHDISVTDSSNTRLWQYYPPFAPSWIRLNEVLLPIEAKGT